MNTSVSLTSLRLEGRGELSGLGMRRDIMKLGLSGQSLIPSTSLCLYGREKSSETLLEYYLIILPCYKIGLM